MSIRINSTYSRLARAALAAGVVVGATTAVVYADPDVVPAQPPSATAPSDSAPQTSSHSLGTAISDATITTKVKYSLETDKRLHDSAIKVTTNNGVVQLTGQVRSDKQKGVAELLASQTKGVKAVDSSQIVVASAG